MRMTLSAAVAVCTLGIPAAPERSIAQQLSATAPSIEPNREIQAQIQRTRQARGAELFRELQNLNDLASKNYEELLKQLAYQVQRVEGDIGTELLALRYLLDHLEASDSAIVRALAPYLNTEDRELRTFVEDWFEYHDSGGVSDSELQPIHYAEYKDYIASRLLKDEPIPVGFVEYIYSRRLRYALLAFVYAHKPVDRFRDVLWAEHLISDAIWREHNRFDEEFKQLKPQAIAELEKLSKHDSWWVRLYAAEIVRQHPELRTEDIVKRLRADPHELVREAMQNKLPESDR